MNNIILTFFSVEIALLINEELKMSYYEIVRSMFRVKSINPILLIVCILKMGGNKFESD